MNWNRQPARVKRITMLLAFGFVLASCGKNQDRRNEIGEGTNKFRSQNPKQIAAFTATNQAFVRGLSEGRLVINESAKRVSIVASSIRTSKYSVEINNLVKIKKSLDEIEIKLDSVITKNRSAVSDSEVELMEKNVILSSALLDGFNRIFSLRLSIYGVYGVLLLTEGENDETQLLHKIMENFDSVSATFKKAVESFKPPADY